MSGNIAGIYCFINCNAMSRNSRIVIRVGRFHNINVTKFNFDLCAYIVRNKGKTRGVLQL